MGFLHSKRGFSIWLIFGMNCFGICYGATSGDFKKFLDERPFSGYNKKIFPRNVQTEIISVDIDYSMVALNNFDEQGGQIDLVGYITARWTNEILTWDINSEHAIEYLYLPQDTFWRPSLIIANSVSSLKELGDNNYKIRIDYQGNHEWKIGVVSQTGCTVIVTYYPFDKQTCIVMLTAWGYTDIQVQLNTTATALDTTLFGGHVEWELAKTKAEVKTIDSASYIIYTIYLQRKPGYFLVNMIIPMLILGLLNGLVFLLPADSGERVGYAITAFLTFAVFLTMVSENLPQASEPMSLLCYFLAVMLILSGVVTVVVILILRVWHTDEDTPVPDYVKHIVAFVTCRKFKKWCGKKKVSENAVADIIENDDDDISDKDVESIQAPVDDSDIKHINWKIVSSTLDGFCFLLFSGITIGCTVYFLVPVFMAEDNTDFIEVDI